MDIAKINLLRALEKNMGIASRSCDAVGLSRQTYVNWMRDDPEFREAVENCEEANLDMAENVLFKKIHQDESLDAVKYYLDRKGKKRGYVTRTELAGVPDAPLIGKTEAELQRMIDEQRQQLVILGVKHSVTEMISNNGQTENSSQSHDGSDQPSAV